MDEIRRIKIKMILIGIRRAYSDGAYLLKFISLVGLAFLVKGVIRILI